MIASWAALVVLLFFLGFALLAIEVLVIPGVGLVGILGAGSLIAAIVVAWTKLGASYGLLAVGGGVAVTGFMIWLFPRTGVGRSLVLRERHVDRHGAAPEVASLVGREGTALTSLRPAGTVEVGDEALDVVTDGVFVEKGARVRIARVEGSRVIVEPLD
jgi:membrane-bound serine protease (ClpP class)